MGNVYASCCKSRPKKSYRELMEERNRELNNMSDGTNEQRDFFAMYDLESKFQNYIDKSNDMALVKEYFQEERKVPFEFDQLVRIFYGALLWKNILYDLAKPTTVALKREQLKNNDMEKYASLVNRLELLEEECFGVAFARIQQAVGADPHALEMTLLFHRKDESKQPTLQEIEKQALDVFRQKKAKDIAKDDKNGLMSMEKKEAMALQAKLQDISFGQLKDFYQNVRAEQRDFALILMEHKISDQFFLATGIEQEELDVVWSKLGLEKDEDYQQMQQEYQEKLKLLSQQLNGPQAQPEPRDCHFAAVIRHGERADLVPGEAQPKMTYRNKIDPPLTPLGIEQAKATGRFLKQYFQDNNYQFEQIVIECSPFLRAMMTAAWIAKELGGCVDIHINYLIAELLFERQFGQENPLPKLEFAQAGCDFEKMKVDVPEYAKAFPEGIKIVEDSADEQLMAIKNKLSKNNVTESLQDFSRAIDVSVDMVSRFEGARPRSCFLFVSHGHFVGGLANSLDRAEGNPLNLDPSEFLDLSPQRREQIENYLASIKLNCPAFCAMTAFSCERATKNVKTELLRHSEHVQDLLRNAS